MKCITENCNSEIEANNIDSDFHEDEVNVVILSYECEKCKETYIAHVDIKNLNWEI